MINIKKCEIQLLDEAQEDAGKLIPLIIVVGVTVVVLSAVRLKRKSMQYS